MEQPGNPVADAANTFAKLAPLLFPQKEQTTTSADPAALARSNSLIDLLIGRGTTTSASDGVIQDILYRAQLAFSPILGAEKSAGIYNSSTKQQLAEDAVNRAAAASASAVAQMQKDALDQAAALTNTNTKASSTAKTQKAPAVSIENLLAGAGVSIGVAEAYKKVKSMLSGEKTPAGKTAMGESDYGEGVKEYFDSGAQAADEGAIDISAFGPVNAGSGGTAAGAGDMFSAAGYNQASLAESSVAPTVLDTALVDETLTGASLADTGAAAGASGIDPSGVAGAGAAGISQASAETIGPIGVQKAQEAFDNGTLSADETGSIVADAGAEGATAAGADVFGLTVGNALALPTGAGMALNEDNMIGGTTDAVFDVLGLDRPSEIVKDIPIVGDTANAVGWIVCTELRRQQRLPRRFYTYGSKIFAAYREDYKPGYYIWAVPTVRHLRRNPNSIYSRFICTIFNWRAEYLAAKMGCKDARKTWYGAAVTFSTYYLCVALAKTIARKPIDWEKVYAAE